MGKKLYRINELPEDTQYEIIMRAIRDDEGEEIYEWVKNEHLKKCRFDKTGYLVDNGL